MAAHNFTIDSDFCDFCLRPSLKYVAVRIGHSHFAICHECRNLHQTVRVKPYVKPKPPRPPKLKPVLGVDYFWYQVH